MELQSFAVVCDSNISYGAGAGQQNRSYYFDWSVIPDGKYELTFCLTTDATTIEMFNQYCLFSNMISPQNVYQAGSNPSANHTAFLGFLRPTGVATLGGASNVYIADLTSNAPLICNRPMTNIFTIGIFNGLTGVLANPFTDYILTLYFKPLRLGLA